MQTPPMTGSVYVYVCREERERVMRVNTPDGLTFGLGTTLSPALTKSPEGLMLYRRKEQKA